MKHKRTKKHIKKQTTTRRKKIMKGRGNNTNKKTAIVCILHSGCGFFSLFIYLCKVYLFAKEKGLPFFVEHRDWQYMYKKGWHDYFKSLVVFEDNGQFNEVKRYESHQENDLKEYPISEYIKCIKEIFVLNDELQSRADDYIKKIGGAYTALYVRQGDKSKESSLMSLDEIIKYTGITDNGITLFVETDDYTVVENLKKMLPTCNILTLTAKTNRGSSNKEMLKWSPSERKANADELFMACYILSKANKAFSYAHSNVGRFHKLYAYDIVELYGHPKEQLNRIFSLNYKNRSLYNPL